MNTDPVTWFFGLIWGLITLAFMISVSRNLRALRKQSERQTDLLAQIAKGLRPKEDPTVKHSSVLYEALQPQKASRGLIIGIAIVLVIILAAIALSSRH